MVERIIGAGYLIGDITMFTPPPGRHHHVIHRLFALRGQDLSLEAQPDLSGFVTSSGRFVNRQEAWKLAEAAGQIIGNPPCPGTLYSEDLW